MIIESQNLDMIVINPKLIKIVNHEMGAGGYIYVDFHLMAYYKDENRLRCEFTALRNGLIDDRTSFRLPKE